MQLEMNDVVSILNRISSLERKVTELESRIHTLEEERNAHVASRQSEPFPEGKVSRKYRALAVFLYECGEEKLVLPYSRIEEILGFSLPETAYQIPHSYWANTGTHSYSSAWIAVGYKAYVNPANRTVRFEKSV